jgi:hypothetical protein
VDALISRLGTRFLVVTVIPTALLLGYLGFLVAAGAPDRSPALARALRVLNGLTIREILALLLGLLIISVATHPLQTPLVQFLEGHWWGLPFGAELAERCTERFRDEMRWAQRQEDEPEEEEGHGEGEEPNPWVVEQFVAEAQHRLDWLPEDEQKLLPTALGNTLLTGESRAGSRYGLETLDALPRLAPLLSPASLADLRDRRNQLDAAVRLCAAAGLATIAGIGLLLWHGRWLFLPLVTYLLCWACYRAAVAAARRFSVSLAAVVDLHHLLLFDALQLERPANLADEFTRNELLGRLFSGFELEEEEMKSLRYNPPKTDGSEKA